MSRRRQRRRGRPPPRSQVCARLRLPVGRADHGCAASGGWLDCLQYCREHGCEWDHRVVEWAISNQQLAVYKWAIGNHAPASEHARARGDSLVRAARIWDEDED